MLIIKLTYQYSLKQHSEYVPYLLDLDLFIIWKKKCDSANKKALNNNKSNEPKYYIYLPIGNRVIFINNHNSFRLSIIKVFQEWSIYKQNKNKIIISRILIVNINSISLLYIIKIGISYQSNINIISIQNGNQIIENLLLNQLFIVEHNVIMTNDGQYLIFWDQKLKKYSKYQIIRV
ncbi:unnamed protein product [Paramecium sonneborni]|uniref:Uncharacterized protein n=1 Tax=Paramecium sonneborni TaxID=65129 RepID=A0A8S1RN77_9CILI|nr:unnamed protein product [Paramecium sonneborni]